mgnify:CR=1 FL=1
MVMSAADLLQTKKNPSDQEIREWLERVISVDVQVIKISLLQLKKLQQKCNLTKGEKRNGKFSWIKS